jgi:hypothetical protein
MDLGGAFEAGPWDILGHLDFAKGIGKAPLLIAKLWSQMAILHEKLL